MKNTSFKLFLFCESLVSLVYDDIVPAQTWQPENLNVNVVPQIFYREGRGVLDHGNRGWIKVKY